MLIDNLAKSSRSSRNTVSAALIIIAVIAMYSWIVAPHTSYLSAAQRYESVVGTIVEQSKAVSRTISTSKRELKKLQKQFAQLKNTLFTPDEARQFFGNLQLVCEQTGCSVYLLNFITTKPGTRDRRPEDTSDIVVNSAILSVVGGYENIIRLVKTLQLRSQKVWIDSINMTSLDDDSVQLKCDITITVCTTREKDFAVYE